ncbi:MAG TPA: gamma-glutamyltransferase [Thiotrichaceae bacterium]|jgi:gamma-glutamyltranspeptidase/glutathione hydrolase|nr:gamma-glutamyltransferase [Thiotrichaceae bacterium]HIM08089.1 gamma-glutamyltransferase [Gammaproteobacteria bacterium]
MKYIFPFVFVLILSSSPVLAESNNQAAVATAHPLATKAGIDILKIGGNAFDAAAAITASLGVVEPYSSGLGGGGFWLIHRASDNKQTMIDGREKAPMLSHKDMYLDRSGNVIKGLSLNGPMAAGIPGVPAGIEHLVKNYGRLSLKEVLAPAIKQAKDGFAVTSRYQKLVGYRSNVVKKYPYAASLFLKDNDVPPKGYLIVQKDLAKTLSKIAKEGSKGFYTGTLARQMVDSIRKNGGIWEMSDLENYNIVERDPIVINYNGIKVTSATLPSSGGIVMGQALNILEQLDLNKHDSITRKHIIIEAMRRAYRDRAAYLGDTDFIDVPIKRLLDKNYAEGMALTINTERATLSSELSDIIADNNTGNDTTHFSVVDAEGNRVSATLSINLPFGSGFVAKGTGVILNNEMDDFSVKSLTANAYGLVGDHANAIAPGKRPLSSMSPTFVETDERIGILGTPGGSRIISMVLLGVLDFAEGNLPASWVSLPRYHHQYLPDQVLYEQDGLTLREQDELKSKGHMLNEKNRKYGNMQAIMIWKSKNITFAASDPRGEGTAEVINVSK